MTSWELVEMIGDLLNNLGLAKWERGFVESLAEQIDDGLDLNDEQIYKLEEIQRDVKR